MDVTDDWTEIRTRCKIKVNGKPKYVILNSYIKSFSKKYMSIDMHHNQEQ